jgi:peptidoglycan/LPS O-acetylase OafA/YrhL
VFGLGAFRFFLAGLVAISHLWEDMMHGPAAYSVWGFYVISGYLMAYILNNHYEYSKKGIITFYYNRFIRIFPAYYFALLLSVLVYKFCVIQGVSTIILNPQFLKPIEIEQYLFNILLLPIFDSSAELVPVSSALSLEVGFYLLAPLLTVNKWCSLTAIVITAGVNYKIGINIEHFADRYAGYWTALFAFSVGSSIFFFKDSFKLRLGKWSYVLWISNCLIWFWYPYYPWTIGLYISVLLTIFILLELIEKKSSSLDNLLGDMSYIIYLLHTTFGYLLICVMTNLKIRGFNFFLVTAFLTLITSLLYVLYIDRYLQDKFKAKYLVKNNAL